jgi:FtsP/CotA-like multicopper oxidase with cupredoxin domain
MPRIPPGLCRRMLLLLAPTAAVLAPVGASAADLTFDLKIERGQVPQNMRVIRVSQGDVVKLRWSTDQPVTLHLHGYDIEQTLERGAVAEMTFTARATGRFPVHVHDGSVRTGSHSHQEAPLVLIEVYPQ